MTIEDCLREIIAKAALLSHFASSAALNPAVPSPDALAGLSDVCDDIETKTRAVKGALRAVQLAIEVKC